jgi:hypothetical protein
MIVKVTCSLKQSSHSFRKYPLKQQYTWSVIIPNIYRVKIDTDKDVRLEGWNRSYFLSSSDFRKYIASEIIEVLE